MKLTKYEQETIINLIMMNRKPVLYSQPADDAKTGCTGCSLSGALPGVEQTEVSKTYSCEKHLINLRKPRKVNEDTANGQGRGCRK